jgi:hypothetical protein
MRIGITGHSNLTAESEPIVADALRKVLAEIGEPVVGVTCLARGADQIGARVVLDSGGEITVILPAADYRERKVKPDNRAEFESLLSRASQVRVLPFETSNRAAYMAASEAVLGDVEHVVAVWDGQPADGHGGTGDVVAAARERGLPVTVVWPDGAARESEYHT